MNFILKEKAVGVNVCNKAGKTALNIAIEHHYPESEQMIVVLREESGMIGLEVRSWLGREVPDEQLHGVQNTIVAVAVLIATLAFSTWMNPSGGVYQDGRLAGRAILTTRPLFPAFMAFNVVALLSSLVIIVTQSSLVAFAKDSLIYRWIVLTTLFAASIACLLMLYEIAAWMIYGSRRLSVSSDSLVHVRCKGRFAAGTMWSQRGSESVAALGGRGCGTGTVPTVVAGTKVSKTGGRKTCDSGRLRRRFRSSLGSLEPQRSDDVVGLSVSSDSLVHLSCHGGFATGLAATRLTTAKTVGFPSTMWSQRRSESVVALRGRGCGTGTVPAVVAGTEVSKTGGRKTCDSGQLRHRFLSSLGSVEPQRSDDAVGEGYDRHPTSGKKSIDSGRWDPRQRASLGLLEPQEDEVRCEADEGVNRWQHLAAEDAEQELFRRQSQVLRSELVDGQGQLPRAGTSSTELGFGRAIARWKGGEDLKMWFAEQSYTLLSQEQKFQKQAAEKLVMMLSVQYHREGYNRHLTGGRKSADSGRWDPRQRVSLGLLEPHEDEVQGWTTYRKE
ncbi:hypothetical protein EJ110_NYTH31761 [Nymphaea thermarum]|nr:hypothetical protein EJ110_NYTH31761 [Nymphaea thermarum]